MRSAKDGHMGLDIDQCPFEKDEEGRAKIPLDAKSMIYRLERIRKQYFMRSLHIREVGSMCSKRLEKMINEFVHQLRLEGKSESEIGDLEIKKGKEFGAQVAAWTPTNAITFKKWMESARKTIDEKKHGGCDCCEEDCSVKEEYSEP